MKVTSYEISKHLKEIGLSEQLGFLDFYYNTEKQLRYIEQEKYTEDENTIVGCFAYDLETILEALPSQIGEGFLQITMLGNQALIGYEKPFIQFSSLTDGKNESLADCAGRLIIKLCEQNLINFNK